MRPIDADRFLRELTALSHGQVWPGWTYDGIKLLIERQPTLTQQNEPLTCEGCIHEEKEHQNCNYCMRASYLGDYYYRCPPEGEEDTDA